MAELRKTPKPLKIFAFIYASFNFIILAALLALCFGTSSHYQQLSYGWTLLSIPAIGILCSYWIGRGKFGRIQTLLMAVSFVCSATILYIAFVTGPQMKELKAEKLNKLQAKQHQPLNQEIERMFLGLYTDDAKIVKEQLNKGVDVNVRNETRQTPLHVTQNAAIAKLLIEMGADLYAKNNLGDTPIFNKEIQIAQILLDAGVDIDDRNEENNTLLIRYTYAGYLDGITYLVKRGADINICNSDKQNPMDIAEHFHPNTDTLKYLQTLDIKKCQ